jgi:phosphoribosylformylglycinamidine synthase
VYRQYDHMVRHGTVVVPGSDAGVVRLRLDAAGEKFLAIANDCNGRYCYLNPYRGAQIALVECLRNLACAGATPLAVTDNLNFGNPYKPDNFWQLRECVRGLAEACRFFDVPVVGGNVSLYNESPDGTIDPTPTVAVVGLIEAARYVTKQWVTGKHEKLILLGGAPDELGGSQYLGLIHGLKTGDAPAVNLAAEKAAHDVLRAQIKAGRVAAAHDLSEGGLLCAVAEMLFTPDGTRGARLDLSALAGRSGSGSQPATPAARRVDALLFGESQGRIIVAALPADAGAVLAAARRAGVPAAAIGEVIDDPQLTLRGAGVREITWSADGLRREWETTIEETMRRPGLEP